MNQNPLDGIGAFPTFIPQSNMGGFQQDRLLVRSSANATQDPIGEATHQGVDPRNGSHPAQRGPKGHDADERVASTCSQQTGGSVVHKGSTTIAAAHVIHGHSLSAQMVRGDDNGLLEVLAETGISDGAAGGVHYGQTDEAHTGGGVRWVCPAIICKYYMIISITTYRSYKCLYKCS